METLEIQLTGFLVAMGAGGIIAVVFFVYERCRQSFRWKGIFLLLMDLFFWVKAAWFTYLWIVIFIEGRVRIFVFLGFALGFFLFWSGIKMFCDLLKNRKKT